MMEFNIKDVGIVIQGPTEHQEKILENIDPNFSYIWSTWDDEPIDNIKAIGKKIPILLNEKPSFNGFRNINMQCVSSLNGIQALKTNWIVKVRSDLLWTNQKGVIELAFNKMIKENSYCSYLNYKSSIEEVHDFVTFSNYQYAVDLWSYRQNLITFKSPETQLCYHIMKKYNWSYDEMVKNMSFINVDLVENELDIYCIKYKCFMSGNANIVIHGNEAFPKK